jgi:hypothetical protein
VGGAVGVAVLGTVFANGISSRAAELAASGPPGDPGLAARIAQVHGTSQAFHVAAGLMVAATVITLFGLAIRHEDLATDVTPGAPAAPDPATAVPFVPPPREAPEGRHAAPPAVDARRGRHRAEP